MTFADRRLSLLALLGMVNYTPQWVRPGGRLSAEEIAARHCGIVLNYQTGQYAASVAISLRLRPDFELVHEPITKVDARIFEEEKKVSLKLRDRFLNSTGGTFLITGFRGVGKTTAVHQALRQLEVTSEQRVISVTVPVARPLSTGDLLFVVIRRLVERLTDMKVITSLTPTVSDRVLTAYQRTSYAHRESSTSSRETGRAYGIGGSLSAGDPRISIPLPRFTRSSKKVETRATELSFLAYGEGDVEHDFLRIVDLLGGDEAVRRGRWKRFWSKLGLGSGSKPIDARIVIVFDEIDKLTESDGGLNAFEQMLGGLKNLLASSGVHFVVVGGVDLHDEWLRESATADSLYRSVFAWQGYVGCSWKAARHLLEEALVDPGKPDAEVLVGYLAYRGRGIIRNVLYEFNELVEWDGDGPTIEIAGIAEERVRLLSELATVLERVFAQFEDSLLSAPSDNDRLRQASYFTVDWVLAAGRDAFTVADVLDPSRKQSLDSILRPSAEIVHSVLATLAATHFLTVVQPVTEKVTEGPEVDPYPEQYKLSDSFLDRLARIAESSPRGRAELGRDSSEVSGSKEAGGTPRKSLQSLLGPWYEIEERVGMGGFGTVWSGFSKKAGKRVALKVIRTPNAEARRRAARESELLQLADMPGVVELLDVIPAKDRMILVTEFVEGESLANVKVPSRSFVVDVGIQIAKILEALHAKGIVHADIKPSNLIVTDDGRVVLIDLGTAQIADEEIPHLSGTPAYMSPERRRGERASDRSDVWSLGLLLWQFLTAKPSAPILTSMLDEGLKALPISTPLRKALELALSLDAAHRPSATEFREMLEATPEALSRAR
jgi:predicted Ser/Thr protein kinase